ncbi:MAG: VOC family protein [Bacteroidota bacterium]|nr:VOC family protein [Bacteroidota bacterium]
MARINAYLNFPGNTEDAMIFYKSVFGGQFTTFQRFSDIPGGEKMSDDDQRKIMNICLPLGDGSVLMATDALESMGQDLILGNNFHLAIQTASEKEADALFEKLSAGGQVKLAMNKAFWNAYFGMLVDKFGIQWMITFDYPQNKPQQ